MVKEATEHTFVFKRLKDKNLLVGVSTEDPHEV